MRCWYSCYGKCGKTTISLALSIFLRVCTRELYVYSQHTDVDCWCKKGYYLLGGRRRRLFAIGMQRISLNLWWNYLLIHFNSYGFRVQRSWIQVEALSSQKSCWTLLQIIGIIVSIYRPAWDCEQRLIWYSWLCLATMCATTVSFPTNGAINLS